MTDKILSQVLSAEIGRQLADNKKAFERILRKVLPVDCEVDPVLADLLEETVRYSAQFSVQFLLRTLEGANVIDLLEDGTPVLYPLDRK